MKTLAIALLMLAGCGGSEGVDCGDRGMAAADLAASKSACTSARIAAWPATDSPDIRACDNETAHAQMRVDAIAAACGR